MLLREPDFSREYTPLSSGYKSKRIKKPAEAGSVLFRPELATSFWRFVAWLTLRPWRRRRDVPLKLQAIIWHFLHTCPNTKFHNNFRWAYGRTLLGSLRVLHTSWLVLLWLLLVSCVCVTFFTCFIIDLYGPWMNINASGKSRISKKEFLLLHLFQTCLYDVPSPVDEELQHDSEMATPWDL
jgi:hypothetical protein